MNNQSLKIKIQDLVCSKCDGGSYNCFNCDISRKIDKLLEETKEDQE